MSKIYKIYYINIIFKRLRDSRRHNIERHHNFTDNGVRPISHIYKNFSLKYSISSSSSEQYFNIECGMTRVNTLMIDTQ
jgi:hypothetical protein